MAVLRSSPSKRRLLVAGIAMSRKSNAYRSGTRNT
jgi:hypothetical protein